jgi:hypothetical protein
MVNNDIKNENLLVVYVYGSKIELKKDCTEGYCIIENENEDINLLE